MPRHGKQAVALVIVVGSMAISTAVRSDECRVQKKTAAPIGLDYARPFDSKTKAIEKMCASFDRKKQDDTKRWEVHPATACN
jgi:hypothetical protein